MTKNKTFFTVFDS